MNSIFAFVVSLGVLVFFHELGHFLVARLFGVGVEKFSLGFGPRVAGFVRGETEYRLSAIPLGGYVKMVGEAPGEEISEEDRPLSFTHKPVWQRMLIVAAGPFFNLLLAVLLFWGLFWSIGEFILDPVVGKVSPDAPAAVAGILPNDKVTAINHEPVESWTDMAHKIAQSGGQPVDVSVDRAGERLTFSITPKTMQDKNIFGEEVERYIIGVTSSGDTQNRQLGPIKALSYGIFQTGRIIQLTALSVVKMIQGTVSKDNIGGPIKITQMAGEQAKAGAAALINFIAFLSINLAILNILPIPVLDGGHLLFFTIEAIMGKPVNRRFREMMQQAGVLVLTMLMIWVFYNDIANLDFVKKMIGAG